VSIKELDPEQTSPKQRRIAAIFLPSGLDQAAVDPFLYSQDFYETHQEVLPRGFGIISGVERLYEERGATLVPRETISFDARGREEGEFAWQICYGDRGTQKVTRLWVQEGALSADYAETSNQGSITKHFLLDRDEAEMVQAHLLERLASPEVEACIQEAYGRRQSLEKTLATLALQKEKEMAELGLSSGFLDKQIAAQVGMRAATGFAPMLVFDANRLKLLRDEQPSDL